MIEELIAREVARATPREANAYLAGAAHDATFNRLHETTRFCQNDVRWLEVLRVLLEQVGSRSWIYREGRARSIWVLETTWRPQPAPYLRESTAASYVRGYFDAEGGMPGSAEARFYIQLVQKNPQDLSEAREMLLRLRIRCGVLHNPSIRVDPDYWRFYVAAASHLDFIDQVGSWHPRKRRRLELERGRPGLVSRGEATV